MRQQPGFLQYPDGHRADVGQRVVVAVRVQPLAGLLPAGLRAVPQREEGLLAAQGRAVAGDLKNLVRAQERAVQPPRHRDERAVGAPVPAEPGQRDEYLARVGDDARAARGGQPRVTHPPGVPEQRRQVVAARLQQDRGLRLIKGLAIPCPGERAPDGAGTRDGIRWRRLTGAGLVGADGTTSFGHRAICLSSP